MSASNVELAACIMPWAKEAQSDAYEKTLKVSGHARAFRNYLVRLVELRYEQDKAWRTQAPLNVLEATAIIARMKLPSGDVIEIAGERKEGERAWGFAEMASLLEQNADLQEVLRVKTEWALIHATSFSPSSMMPQPTMPTATSSTTVTPSTSKAIKRKSPTMSEQDTLFESR